MKFQFSDVDSSRNSQLKAEFKTLSKFEPQCCLQMFSLHQVRAPMWFSNVQAAPRAKARPNSRWLGRSPSIALYVEKICVALRRQNWSPQLPFPSRVANSEQDNRASMCDSTRTETSVSRPPPPSSSCGSDALASTINCPNLTCMLFY